MNKKIYILGLGAGSVEALTLQAYRLLQKRYPLYLRTERHPVVDLLLEEKLDYICFDDIYDQAEDFDQVYEQIVDQLLMYAEQSSTPIVYAVPGHPMVAERTVKQLRERAIEQQIEVEMISSSSFLDDMFNLLNLDPNDGFMLLDGLDLKETLFDNRMHLIITQVYNQKVASDVKLALMEYYPGETEISVIRAAGVKGLEKIWRVPLYEIDRIPEIDHLTTVYIPKGSEREQYRNFGALVDIIKSLRGPAGCPWDQEQTHESLRSYLIEEAYEVLDAIDNQDSDNLAEELGDILLHVIMHAQIAVEEGEFNIYQVVETIANKMVRRHPHVFGEAKQCSVEQVNQTWDEIKRQEKQEQQMGHQTDSNEKSVLAGIPKGLPMLLYAFKQQKKAAKVGFDWQDAEPVWDKLREEMKELQEAKDQQQQYEEMGDLLYTVVNLARVMQIDPEQALRQTCQKFQKRFEYIEAKMTSEGLTFADVSLEWMDKQWEKAKKM